VTGIAGLIYTVIVARRMATQNAYSPVFEDWLFHAILPLAAYVVLIVAAVEVASYRREVLFGIGGSSLLLLLIGIHNAWDAVTWNIFDEPAEHPHDEVTVSEDDSA
jgi:hypothetical protein